MPRDAVAAGLVDAVLSVNEIGPRLAALAREEP
jgi:chemotaxis response regulator CheB